MAIRPTVALRRRRGCGCLGCLPQLFVLIVLGVVLVVGIDWVFAPWGFFLGGTFRPLPVWQGIAHIRASSGDYVLYVWLSPGPGGRTYNYPSFSGTGALCTPRGERFPMKVRAYMFEHPGRDTNGKEMRLEVYYRSFWAAFNGAPNRPELTLRGRWQNPDLVMNDGGTLSRAFLPDGQAYTGPPAQQPRARETVPVVFHEVPWTTWFGDCRAEK